MSDFNQNQGGDYQNFHNYQNNNQNNQDNNQNYQVININEPNHPMDEYSINPSEYRPPSEDNINDLPTEELVNSQAPIQNNDPNDTPQASDMYPPLSDQVAPPISIPDMVTDQQMTQPPAEPINQPDVQQAPPIQPIPFDNAPIVELPPQPRIRPACRGLSIFGGIASIIASIIIIVRHFSRK